jgi:hypothetical protein
MNTVVYLLQNDELEIAAISDETNSPLYNAIRIVSYSDFSLYSLVPSNPPRSTFEANLVDAPVAYFKALGGVTTSDGVAQFNKVDEYTTANFNTSTCKYTAPVNGFYSFKANLQIPTPRSGSLTCYLRRTRGGTTIYLATARFGTAGHSFDTEVVLESGDEIDIYVVQGNLGSSSLGLEDSFTNPVTIEQLSDSVSGAYILSTFEGRLIQMTSPSYYFKAYGGTNTITNNSANYPTDPSLVDSIFWDPNGGTVANFSMVDPASSAAFNTSTHKYTVPVRGVYRFASTINAGGTNKNLYAARLLWCDLRCDRGDKTIVLNSTRIGWGSGNTISTEVSLEVGDAVYIFVAAEVIYPPGGPENASLGIYTYSTPFSMDALTDPPISTFEGRLVSEIQDLTVYASEALAEAQDAVDNI